MSQPDYLARPAHPEASRHNSRVSPTYCLRQCRGVWYLLPFIYEWGFSEYVKAWREEHEDHPNPGDLPAYAKLVDVAALTFQQPNIVE